MREPTPAALAVTIVHGTFPRGPWQQLRRNLRALWTRVRRRQFDEAAMWPAPASQCDQRWWFEPDSEFERDLVRRSGLDVVFHTFSGLVATVSPATTIIAIVLGLGGWVLLWHFFAAALLLLV
ncbi:MAG TPA: hypothetical protein VFK30_02710, partial [Anaerolineae bacterium]|nr:hypothetical protein [Anaerolineae bacterium]